MPTHLGDDGRKPVVLRHFVNNIGAKQGKYHNSSCLLQNFNFLAEISCLNHFVRNMQDRLSQVIRNVGTSTYEFGNYYIPKLFNTESQIIKLRFSDAVSLFLKMRLMSVPFLRQCYMK